MAYKSVTLIISPYHVGLKNIRVGQGPQTLLDAGLVKVIKNALPVGIDVHVKEIESVVSVPTKVEGDIGRSFAVLRNISSAVHQAAKEKSWPLVLGGNCMGVVGVYAGLNSQTVDDGHGSRASREVIWFDAHADLETSETTVSGYLDGMGGSMLMGEGFGTLLRDIPGYGVIDGRQLLSVGFRDLSEFERKKIKERKIRTVWGEKPLDCGQYAQDLRKRLAEETDLTGAILHLDVDVLDTSVGQANEFAVPGGLGVKDLVECVELIGDLKKVEAMHLASLNPDCNEWQNVAKAAIQAIECMVKKIF
ncbi:hypothetical protein H2200_005330 [Cladophialophora chaetospira]|uniref:Arginase n=1 Tax=Cladophialophora chaetospira TaxID=386627 RepID=A0AA38XBS6_9EURO|nr:hypothetical protein H2200_005330 [Cladophialophora chaetospira]